MVTLTDITRRTTFAETGASWMRLSSWDAVRDMIAAHTADDRAPEVPKTGSPGGSTRPGRIVGAERQRLARSLAEKYQRGHSLAELRRESGRSVGFVRGLLLEAGVDLRGHGGHHPPPA